MLALAPTAAPLAPGCQVVDMFGCGLPVCALSYACIGELVSHEHNGLLFENSHQLAQQLLDCFRGFPGGPAGKEGRPTDLGAAAAGGGSLLAQLRRGVAGASMARWDDTWRKTVLPVLEGASTGPSR